MTAKIKIVHAPECAGCNGSFVCCICGKAHGVCLLAFRDRGPDRLHECRECWGEDQSEATS